MVNVAIERGVESGTWMGFCERVRTAPDRLHAPSHWHVPRGAVHDRRRDGNFSGGPGAGLSAAK
jgi:hypothetical protein